MKICQYLLRLISPGAEKERMEFRRDLARAEAHSEEFHRTVCQHVDQLAEIGRKPQIP